MDSSFGAGHFSGVGDGTDCRLLSQASREDGDSFQRSGCRRWFLVEIKPLGFDDFAAIGHCQLVARDRVSGTIAARSRRPGFP